MTKFIVIFIRNYLPDHSREDAVYIVRKGDKCLLPPISLPKISQAESRTWDKIRTVPGKKILIFIEHCDELVHPDNWTYFSTF